MKNLKRIMAGAGALLLLGMYIATLIFALIDHPSSDMLFKASLICTVVIPVLLYGYTLVYKVTRKNDESEE